MRLVLLGTSSAVPTLTRGLSATALVREGDVFLFDCGEGTQLQLMRSTVKRSRIHSIFIGHLHGDHLYGIAGLLSTLHLDARPGLGLGDEKDCRRGKRNVGLEENFHCRKNCKHSFYGFHSYISLFNNASLI